MHLEFVEWLDRVRGDLGKPILITSGFRCSFNNELVGGAVRSQHLYGRAVDIRRPDDGGEAFKLLGLMLEGSTGIGVYKDHFHVDWRPIGADGGWAFWTGE